MANLDSCYRSVPNPRCVQWWYLLLLTDDGEVYRVRLWVQGPEGPEQRCGVELCRTRPVGEPSSWEQVHAAPSFHGERDRLHVMVEASSIEQRSDGLHLAVRLPGVELELQAEPSLRWPRPVIGYDIDGLHGWCWTVPMLRGRAFGRVRLAGAWRDLAGTLFCDHVCADTAPSPDWLVRYRGWWWAVLWTPERSLLVLDVDFAGAPMRRAFEALGEGSVRPLDSSPLRCEGRREPRFTLEGDTGGQPARPLWSWPKRHRVLERPVVERLVNAWPGLRKRHILAEMDGGHLYAEWMSVR